MDVLVSLVAYVASHWYEGVGGCFSLSTVFIICSSPPVLPPPVYPTLQMFLLLCETEFPSWRTSDHWCSMIRLWTLCCFGDRIWNVIILKMLSYLWFLPLNLNCIALVIIFFFSFLDLKVYFFGCLMERPLQWNKEETGWLHKGNETVHLTKFWQI